MSVSRWPDNLTEAELRHHLSLGITSKPIVKLLLKVHIEQEKPSEPIKQLESALSLNKV